MKPSRALESVDIQFPTQKPESNTLNQQRGISNSTSFLYQIASTLLKNKPSKALESVYIQLPPRKSENNRNNYISAVGHLKQLIIDVICLSDNINASKIRPSKTSKSINIQLSPQKSENNKILYQQRCISRNSKLVFTFKIRTFQSAVFKKFWCLKNQNISKRRQRNAHQRVFWVVSVPFHLFACRSWGKIDVFFKFCFVFFFREKR